MLRQKPKNKISWIRTANACLQALVVLFVCVLIVSYAGAQEQPQDAGASQFPFLGEVKGAKELNIRSGQSTSFERIGSLTEKETVVVTARQFNWFQVKLPASADSYVSAKFVRPLANGVGEITGDRVNVRARSNQNAVVLGQLNKGALVRILAPESDGWLKIEPPEGVSGWVSADYLVFKTKDVPAPQVVSATAPQTAIAAPTVAAVQEKKEIVAGSGTIVDLGAQAISDDVRHKIILADKTVYYLQGYRKIIDGFLHSQVDVEGQVLLDVKADHPVILVTKIKWVL